MYKRTASRIKYICSMKSGENITSLDIKETDVFPVYGGNGLRGYFNKYTHAGDYILIGRQGALAGNVHKVNGKFWATDHAVVTKPFNNININFLYFLLLSLDLNQYSINTAAQPGLAVSKIQNLSISIPSINEQTQIANFLDTQCAEIDALSADIQTQIEVLEKYRQSVITEAVTKGLNPNVEMKDSGIPWIGMIPKEWKVDKLKFNLKRTEPRNPGDSIVLSLYRDFGVIPKDSRNDNHNVTSFDTSNYKYVQIGNFVVNKMKAWQGSVAVSDYEGIVSPAYYVYQFTNNKLHRKYFHYLIRCCYKEEFRRLSGGIRVDQWDLPSSQLDNVAILIPTLITQHQIAAYLDTKCAEIDAIIQTKQKQLETLAAYKKSLIFEYVTGKKEVPLCIK